MKIIDALWRASHKSYSRPYFIGRGGGHMPEVAIFYPGTKLTVAALEGSLDHIFETMKTFAIETETVREKIVTLEEKITEVLGRVQKEGELRLKGFSDNNSRSEMIVVFLAILHLAREQLILLEQMENFSDIMVKRK